MVKQICPRSVASGEFSRKDVATLQPAIRYGIEGVQAEDPGPERAAPKGATIIGTGVVLSTHCTGGPTPSPRGEKMKAKILAAATIGSPDLAGFAAR